MPQLPDAEPVDGELVGLLHSRDGQETSVELDDGRWCRVLNIAWGHDSADHYAHITTNISPSVPGYEIDFFFTNEVVTVSDPASTATLWSRGELVHPRRSYTRVV